MPHMNREPDVLASMRALYPGDHDATRAYCGAYRLIRDAHGTLYRTRETREGDTEVADAYDTDGFLLDRYWSLPRR